MTPLVVVLAFGVAVAVLAVAWVLIRGAGRLTRIDLPDARRLHARPTPRGGGLGMPFAITLAASLAVALDAPGRRDLWIAVAGFSLPNGLLGVVDDYRPLRSRTKFATQIGLAILFVAIGPRVDAIAVPPIGTLRLGILAAPFTVLFLVWATNVYNFMDGMDALAAGSGAAFFGTLAVLALGSGAGDAPAAAIAVFGAAACLGFLVVNLPPAKIFMGDGGALYVGALLGALAVVLAGGDRPRVPFASAMLAMGSFMWDATYTMAMRMVRRETWYLPHKRHLFQRLVTSGWSHSRVRGVYVLLAIAGSFGAVTTGLASPVIAGVGLAVAGAAFVATSLATERLEARARARGAE